MIQGTSSGFTVTVSGLAVYLDTWAVIELAKHNPLRRRRFVEALRTGDADLVFSVANAVELTGPQGDSRDAVRVFLDDIGSHWFPVELNVTEVVLREQHSADPAKNCVSEQFFMDHCAHRMRDYTPGSGKVIDASELYGLGTVVDWVHAERDSIRRGIEDLDATLVDRINGHFAKSEADRLWLDQAFPVWPFIPSQPATFMFVNLVRTLILEAKSHRLKTGDGLDFSHAVMGSAFANFVALDKHWKRRVERLPENRLARVYDRVQLDQMVTDIELTLKQRGTLR
jgi:hypothetical protein